MATLDTIALPDDFIWPDEHVWSPVVAMPPKYTLGGNMKVHSGVRLAGRPITLTGNEYWFLVDRPTLAALKALEAQQGLEMTLTFDPLKRPGVGPFTVIYRHWEGGVEATPWIDYGDPVDTDLVKLTLRLMEV